MIRSLLKLLTTIIMMIMPFMVFAVDQGGATCPELTTVQVAAGYLTVENFLRFAVGTLAVIAVLLIVFGFAEVFFTLWLAIRPVSDLFGFAATGAFLYFVVDRATEWRSILAFAGAIFFAFSLAWCLHMRVQKKNNQQNLFLLLLIGFVPIAIYFNSEPVGYLAAIALICLFRFTVFVSSLTFALGYESENDLSSGTLASIMTLIIFLVIYLSIRGTPSLEYFKVFVQGVFWTSSIAGFTGLLILSSKFYAEDGYFMKQVATVIVLIAGVAVGIQFNIPGLSYMGLLMLFLFGLGKLAELKTKGMLFNGLKIGGISLCMYFMYSQYIKHKPWIETFASTNIPT